MIVGLAVKNFKGLKTLKPPLALKPFHVLVGPNASGKTTFLDVIEFVKDCLVLGPRKAVEARAPQFRDLTYLRNGGKIEIELWLDLTRLPDAASDGIAQYRIALKEDKKAGVAIEEEELRVREPLAKNGEVFSTRGLKKILGKTATGRDVYYRENQNYQDSFEFGLDKSTLSLTPPDQTQFPTANAVRRFLMGGVRYLKLNSDAMRWPCPATKPTDFELDGSNLPKVVGKYIASTQMTLFDKNPRVDLVAEWVGHLRYALGDLRRITWNRRRPDNAEYIELKYSNGLACPSWLMSDGTLRMLALTLLAFENSSPAIFMVEEPENGVHPKALEIIVQSLQSIPFAQTLVATHSPLVVQQVGVEPLLCFSQSETGFRVVPGPEHEIFKDWDGTPDISTIFSSGILG